ncbi:hypothetical protein [Intestinimonas sp. HCP28S3_D6]|uniref:hypothetical protein n=1 Tax=Intestinimonas sp. HCP28S3_D6 TaxID=3438942 RepID=UPI003F8C55AD
MTKAFRNRKTTLWLLAGIAALFLAAGLLWRGRPAEARPALTDYVGDLDGYETVRATRQDGQTLTLEGAQAAELKGLLDQLSFAGAAEEKPSRANSAPGVEAVVRLESSMGAACSVTFVTNNPETSHMCLGLPDGTEVHIIGAFQADYRAATDFINGL